MPDIFLSSQQLDAIAGILLRGPRYCSSVELAHSLEHGMHSAVNFSVRLSHLRPLPRMPAGSQPEL